MSDLWWTIAVVAGCVVVAFLTQVAFSLVRGLQRKSWDKTTDGVQRFCVYCMARVNTDGTQDHDEWCPRWRVPQ